MQFRFDSQAAASVDVSSGWKGDWKRPFVHRIAPDVAGRAAE